MMTNNKRFFVLLLSLISTVFVYANANAKQTVSNNHDIKMVIINGNSAVNTGAYTPKATVKNNGSQQETFDVICKIFDHSGNQLYSNTKSITLNTNETNDNVSFNTFTLSNQDTHYKLIIYSSLVNDEDLTNDTLTKNIYTYTHNRDMVLLEIATGTWCHFCPGAAKGADDLISNGYNVAVVEYHKGDSYGIPSSAARIDFYNIYAYPSNVFDGEVRTFSTSNTNSLYPKFKPVVEDKQIIKTGITLDLTGSKVNNTYSINLNINKIAPVEDDSLKAFLILTESDIAENWQGMTKLDFVCRKVLPNENGILVDIKNNSQLNLSYNLVLDNSWVPNQLELVAFVQNKITKEVLNCTKKKLKLVAGFENPKAINNQFHIYPNPCQNSISIKTDASISRINIYSLAGRLLISTSETKNIEVSELSPGMYIVELLMSNGDITPLKFVKQ